MNAPSWTTADLYRLVRARLARWRTHPDYEDLVQEAAIRTWQAWEAKPGVYCLSTLAYHAAPRAAADWLRSGRAMTPKRRGEDQPAPEMLSLDALTALWRDRPARPGFAGPREPRRPDFVPALLERFEERERLQTIRTAWEACLPLHYQTLLTRLFFTDAPPARLAREQGVSTEAICQQRNRALGKLREALGLSARWTDLQPGAKNKKKAAVESLRERDPALYQAFTRPKNKRRNQG